VGNKSKEVKPKVEDVELSSLEMLKPFKYEGRLYTKRRPSAAGIRALSKKGDELITLPPDTMITPAK